MGTKASNPVFDGDHSVSRWETDRMFSVSMLVKVLGESPNEVEIASQKEQPEPTPSWPASKQELLPMTLLMWNTKCEGYPFTLNRNAIRRPGAGN